VVGAGGAGLAAAHALKARGVPFVVYEAGSGIGGNWRYENDSGLCSAYASLTTNVSRQQTSYRCFPLRTGPLYLHHSEMLAYLEAFTDHFGLREHIRLGSPVRSVRALDDGGWDVRTGDSGPQRYRAVLVATGYNSVPRYPDLPGRFDGLEMHSHHYRTPEPFAGRDTVVIGLGCSAAELACEIRPVARSTTIAARSGNWVMPRRLGPMPFDWLDTRAGSRLPFSLRRRMIKPLARLAGAELGKAGVLRPSGRLLDKPWATSDDLTGAWRAGEISVTGPVTELAGDRVLLADGRELPADAILYGTGYRAEYPFLPPDVEPPTLERPRLYRGIAHPHAPGLFFIGLAMAHGALIPIFEAQANWAAEVLTDRLALPSTEVMCASIAHDDEVRVRDFDPRWGILWDRLPYIRSLETETRAARRSPGTSRRAAAPTVR
jgi:cation diffusion facilitator CzcD-associated flavoprotein CzcO